MPLEARKRLVETSKKPKREIVPPGTKKAVQGKTKPKKGKVPTPSKLKAELDRVFSLYIRAKYPKECYTCRAKGKTLQCGHFVSRTYLATRWDENNCRPQCVGCNIWGAGKPLDFEDRLVEDLGAEAVSQIKQKRKEITKLTRADYEERIAYYKGILESVEKHQTPTTPEVQ